MTKTEGAGGLIAARFLQYKPKNSRIMDYKIVCYTDPYHAGRHPGFTLNSARSRGFMVLDSGLTLQEAKTRLLRLFCEDAGRWFPNWGVACAWKGDGSDIYARPTSRDGSRSYHDDVFDVEIEPEA